MTNASFLQNLPYQNTHVHISIPFLIWHLYSLALPLHGFHLTVLYQINWTTPWITSHILYPYPNLPSTVCNHHFHDDLILDNNTLTQKTTLCEWVIALFTHNLPFRPTIHTAPSHQPLPSASFIQLSPILGMIFDLLSLNHHTTARITKHTFSSSNHSSIYVLVASKKY